MDSAFRLDGVHIAMVVRSFSTEGGLELYTHKLVEGLLQRRFRVTVVCEKSSSALVHPNLSVVNFPAAPARSRKSQGIEHCFKWASKAVEDNGPFDIIHSQHLAIARADVVTFHNHTAGRLAKVGAPWERMLNRFKTALIPAYRLRDQYDGLLCRSARCLIFPAQVMKEDYYATYGRSGALDATPWAVAYPGAELGQDQEGDHSERGQCATAVMPRDGGEQRDAFTFLFVGKGYRKKGLDVLLSACRLLAQDGLEFRLLIAGLRAKLVDAVNLKRLGLDRSVAYLGFQKDMDAVFRRASVLVMPSKMEPFGMAALQAMDRGLVPIVSRVAGVAELLTHEDSALILEDHLDAQELAGHMRRLMTESELLRAIRSEARRIAREATWDRTIEATLKAYRLVLTGQPLSAQSVGR